MTRCRGATLVQRLRALELIFEGPVVVEVGVAHKRLVILQCKTPEYDDEDEGPPRRDWREQAVRPDYLG